MHSLPTSFQRHRPIRRYGSTSLSLVVPASESLRSVKEKSAVNKSMMASKNLPNPITKASQGHHWIRVLAAELALRLREAREEMPALWPKTLVLHARRSASSLLSHAPVGGH